MKKFKFFKILYYGLVILAGLIMCVVLPNYNEYTMISNEIRAVVENKEFDKLPGFFYSKYYNGECVYGGKIKDQINEAEHDVYVFETILYHDYDKTNRLSYAKEAYMVFIMGGSTFDYSLTKDEYGNDVNNSKLFINDKEVLKDETFYKINDRGVDILYFDISKYDMEAVGLASFNSISIENNASKQYMNIDLGKELNYNSQFYTYAQEYLGIYNSVCTNFEASLNGTFTLESNNTKMASGSKITINPYGFVKVYIEADGTYEVTGAKKVDEVKNQDGTIKEPAHYVVSERSVVIKATSDVTLKSILVNFDDIDVKFSFDGSNEGYYLAENVTPDKEHRLGVAYNSEELLKQLEEWEKDYTFAISNVGANLTAGRIRMKTIIQIVIYFVVALIIGDFLVGKHYIIYFFQKIFKKKKANEVEEEVVVNNEYNVNVEIKAFVPVGYENDVYVKYVKDEEHIIEVTLKHSTGYKHAERFQNGTYKLEKIVAPGLHQMKPMREVKVRGFKFKIDLMLANDEGVTPVVTKNEE